MIFTRETGAEDVLVERRKRRREILWIFALALAFLVLTWIEIQVYNLSQTLRFEHSIFFFGLVNFNIILFLFMFFLIFRNVVKIFSERQGRLVGRTLQGKLVAAFVLFSFVPTTLMFLVSVFYINNSFDKWFSERVSGVLKSSLEVSNAYYGSARKRNFHFANQMAQELSREGLSDVSRRLDGLRVRYALDAVEFYPQLFGQRVVSAAKSDALSEIPPVSIEFLSRGIRQRAEASTTHHFADGDLVRVIVPVIRGRAVAGALVVSSFVPLSLISRMDDVAGVYEEFRDQNTLESPLRSIYMIILVLMTVMILVGATWFGFYLAKQLAVPIAELGAATQRVARGDYQIVKSSAGSVELNRLIANFNSMTRALETSEREVRDANRSLKSTLSRLDERTRYIEVVLSNVSTGVISVDRSGIVTMINHHAAKLLHLDPEKYIGRPAQEMLSSEYATIFDDLLRSMKKHRARSLGKEVRVTVDGQQIPLQMTMSILYDEEEQEVGKVLTFDDLSPVLRAQRAAAWTEVARRIAHEIKNPLTPIKLCAERLQKKFGAEIADPQFRQSTQIIIEQVDSLKTLVNEFSQFARLPKVQPVLGSLNAVVEDLVLFYRSAHRNCRFFFEADANLPNFRFDPEQMKRVVTNLLDNSLAAVQGSSERDIHVRTQYDPLLQMARLTIADTGPGIPEDMRERIFEPYVTTKDHGTGLGLAIVKRTVEDHNGFIRALANAPRGTRMVIELPVVDSLTEDVARQDSSQDVQEVEV